MVLRFLVKTMGDKLGADKLETVILREKPQCGHKPEVWSIISLVFKTMGAKQGVKMEPKSK